ncbi:MAG: hypothetical protein KZQ99_18420 [Candidatus Thiodiazotropha sp. (ex Dulcina madagascariensis)]|nr:hypothetical protein [Candidatus Thiodiazotropha sp. (ex Dulcina madagascariensis)]
MRLNAPREAPSGCRRHSRRYGAGGSGDHPAGASALLDTAVDLAVSIGNQTSIASLSQIRMPLPQFARRMGSGASKFAVAVGGESDS